ncbi:MAG: hypothetical protein KHX03_01975 [Clostridium sp.]|nr:hypothetical protein [Clostridium sp.]
MKITPFTSSLQDRNASINKKSSSEISFGEVVFNPTLKEITRIYKNGPDIAHTLSTIMKKIDDKYEGLMNFEVQVAHTQEPRLIRVKTKVSMFKFTELLEKIVKSGKEENLHPNLLKNIKRYLEGNFANEKESKKVYDSIKFIGEEVPVARINYYPYEHPERKADFIKNFEEALSMKKIFEKMNKEFKGNPDFSIKKTVFERMFG